MQQFQLWFQLWFRDHLSQLEEEVVVHCYFRVQDLGPDHHPPLLLHPRPPRQKVTRLELLGLQRTRSLRTAPWHS
jgi:hypothetical protein